MPFKSKAHRSKMRELLAKGVITAAQYEEVAAGTPAILPDRVPNDGDPEQEEELNPQAKRARLRPNPFW